MSEKNLVQHQQSTKQMWITLRVARFTPKPERKRSSRGASPFAKRSSSPFGAPTATSTSSKRIRGKHWTQEYRLQVRPEDTVLDMLLAIKRTVDPTLAFRYSCGHGMCGSDAVAINGTPTLLCTAKASQWARPKNHAHVDGLGFRKTTLPQHDAEQSASADSRHQEWVIDLAALPGFLVVKDLIADIDPMMEQIKRLQPYLQAAGTLKRTEEGKIDVFEYLQKPEELAQYELLSNCIACGVCEGSCPVYAGGEAFVGPAAIVMASRFMHDSRDVAGEHRLEQVGEPDAAPACQSVRACSLHCPKGIDVGEEIWKVIQQVDQARV